MALLHISSSNPNLSFVLAKNPATILSSRKPFERSLRKGKVYGWFGPHQGLPDQAFTLLFKDSETETSFGVHDEFEYLDISRYCHPYTYIAMLTECLASVCKKQQEHDVARGPLGPAGQYEAYHAHVSANVKIPLSIARRLKSVALPNFLTSDAPWAIPELEEGQCYFRMEEISGPSSGIYRVVVAGRTVNSALNYFQVICILAALTLDDIRIPLNKDALQKYARVLSQAHAPYVLRHLFAVKAITNDDVFKELAPVLNTDEIQLAYGNSQIQRSRAISAAFHGTRAVTLIDIGCGELFHARKLARKYECVYAFEADPETFEAAGRIAQKYALTNVEIQQTRADKVSVDAFAALFEGADVLMTEVLEHIELPEALETLEAVLKTQANQVLVTVPNHDFNQFFYMEEGEFRHPDHKWEPDFADWCDTAAALGAEHGWVVETKPLGDVVQDVSLGIQTLFTRALAAPTLLA